MGIFDWFKKKKKSNDVVEKFEEFQKSIDTSTFSETQKKSTEIFFSDIKKNLKDEDGQPDTKTSNKVEDVIKNEQSNSEERLEIITDGKIFRVTGSENIRKTKELNDPDKNNISSLFTLNEYYDNGNIKKETEKLTVQNLYTEKFYDENGVLKKENCYLINENRLCEESIYDDSENYQHNHHYEGGEIRKSFYVDGLQEGIEKVFDKNGNLVEEHTYKRGRNTYYKRFIDGKVSEESVMDEELKEDEEEIMQIAKSIDTSSFVSFVDLLPADLSEFEGDTFYDVTEQFIILLKNGKEVASGYICISHNANYWDDEGECHDDIQSHHEVMIVKGKQFTDYDDEQRPSWSESSSKTKRIATFWDDDEAEEFFNEYVEIKCKGNN
jgi:antitoxin component YwqK of YwqJK toxin-antitoxin module